MAVASGPACEGSFLEGRIQKIGAARPRNFFFALRATISVSAKCTLSKTDSYYILVRLATADQWSARQSTSIAWHL